MGGKDFLDRDKQTNKQTNKQPNNIVCKNLFQENVVEYGFVLHDTILNSIVLSLFYEYVPHSLRP